VPRSARIGEVRLATFRKYFAAEIATGATKVKSLVGNCIVASILGRDGGLTDQLARARLAVLFAKTRMGWTETVAEQPPNKGGNPFVWQAYPEDDKL